MLLNRSIEWWRHRRPGARHLARRAKGRPRRPLIIVPPAFGVRLVDAQRRQLWGHLGGIVPGGRSFVDEPAASSSGPVECIPVLPGIAAYDVLGGLIQYLSRIGGYRVGQDLFVVDYDWRQHLAAGARSVADRVAAVRGISEQRVDLLAISSGGLVARHFLAWGGADPDREEATSGTGAQQVDRVVYVGVPQQGSFSSFAYTQEGFRFFAGTRAYSGPELQRCPGLFSMMPGPEQSIFVDDNGDPLSLDHYSFDTWLDLGLVVENHSQLRTALEQARRDHQALAASYRAPQSIAIAANHRPTAERAVIDRDGGVAIPCGECRDDVERYPFAFSTGDGVVPRASLEAVPGLVTDDIWWVESTAHHRVATDAFVHPVILEALLTGKREAAGVSAYAGGSLLRAQ